MNTSLRKRTLDDRAMEGEKNSGKRMRVRADRSSELMRREGRVKGCEKRVSRIKKCGYRHSVPEILRELASNHITHWTALDRNINELRKMRRPRVTVFVAVLMAEACANATTLVNLGPLTACKFRTSFAPNVFPGTRSILLIILRSRARTPVGRGLS